MGKFDTKNTRVHDQGSYDSATARLMRSVARSIDSDRAFLARLPVGKFSAEAARQAWGYSNIQSAYAKIRLLEDAGLIELALVRVPWQKQGKGSRWMYCTWSKAAQAA